jgi:hypothetical protein
MSYLNGLRLHFAGRFQANVSTVNNDPAHFHNAAFLPSYQDLESEQAFNGWFNPQGDAVWRLLGCRVTSAWTAGGAVSAGDPVLGAIVADSDSRPAAKLVDLDSEQQLVSEIWGLQVRIATADGTTLMVGDFEPAAFLDIWDRSTGGTDDAAAGAMYQSVLTGLQWADVSTSAFLTALQRAAGDGTLSIKFNVDGFNMDLGSPDFMTGRVVGTIGPATRGEPQHLVIGRQFMAAPAPKATFFKPLEGINFSAGVVDAAAGRIYLDLGNALTTGANGAINDQGDLTLSVGDAPASPADAGTPSPVGTIPSAGPAGYASDPAWYARTAGVVVLPISPALLPRVQASPLTLSGKPGVSIGEWSNGTFVRADRFVYRLSPGDRVEIPVYAMQWGRPLGGVELAFELDPSQLQAQVGEPGDNSPYVAPSPPVARPTSALAFTDTVTTNNDGVAALTLDARDPGSPRWFNKGAHYGIDGQVYGIRPRFSNKTEDSGPENQWNFVSILVASGFTPADPVTWTDVQPILQQYANLYPVMNRFLNLADRDSVVANTWLLQVAFGLDPADPNAMPVTRDLSPAKRHAILTWLKNPLAGPVPAPEAAPLAAIPPKAPGAAVTRGGKAAAAARRLVLQTRAGASS